MYRLGTLSSSILYISNRLHLPYTSAIGFICIMRRNVDRHRRAVIDVLMHDSRATRIARVAEENHNHRYVIVEMASYALLNFLYVIESNLSFLCSLLKGSSHQSLGYPLQILFLMSNNNIICAMNQDVNWINWIVIMSS